MSRLRCTSEPRVPIPLHKITVSRCYWTEVKTLFYCLENHQLRRKQENKGERKQLNISMSWNREQRGKSKPAFQCHRTGELPPWLQESILSNRKASRAIWSHPEVDTEYLHSGCCCGFYFHPQTLIKFYFDHIYVLQHVNELPFLVIQVWEELQWKLKN